MEQEYLLGKNNYCLSSHTMQERDNLFSLIQYKNMIKLINFDEIHYERKKTIDYKKLISEE